MIYQAHVKAEAALKAAARQNHVGSDTALYIFRAYIKMLREEGFIVKIMAAELEDTTPGTVLRMPGVHYD